MKLLSEIIRPFKFSKELSLYPGLRDIEYGVIPKQLDTLHDITYALAIIIISHINVKLRNKE